jgi:pimeloyl-ACP methyl ester carboxylesterase
MRLLDAVLGLSLLAAAGTDAATLAPGPILTAAPSQYATVDGARIHYKVIGRGRPTIVFLHGLGGDINVWREQVSALHDRAHLILIDLPGHGGSDAPATYSMRGFARAVSAVLKQTKAQRAVLVGHSLGALVAREVDRYYPGYTRAIVSVDGLLKNPIPDPESVAKIIASFKGDDGDARLGRFYDGMLTMAPAELREQVRSTALATPRSALLATFEAALLPEVWTDDKLSVPLYAVIARNPHTDDTYLQYVRALGRDVTVDVIDGVDHFLMLDMAPDFNARLEKWLAAHHLIK